MTSGRGDWLVVGGCAAVAAGVGVWLARSRSARGDGVVTGTAGLGDLIATIKPDECENYFRNAGYASVKR